MNSKSTNIVRHLIGMGLLCLSCNFADAAALKTGLYYANETIVDAHTNPNLKAPVVNKHFRRDSLNVYELKNGWVRVTKYYRSTGLSAPEGQVIAEWVQATKLSPTIPSELKQPNVPNDPRIAKDAFPKVGESDLTTKDILILHKGAQKFLNSGVCTHVEFGDSDYRGHNRYYVNCGGANIFFTPSDLR